MQTGMSKEQADEVIDRIVVEPGQLTSYEVGGLEILSLRETARIRFGPKFDLRTFHQRVLEKGVVPLKALRKQVNRWIESQSPCAGENCSRSGTTILTIPMWLDERGAYMF
jgi:uncharacterized protein (DUF885 family)